MRPFKLRVVMDKDGGKVTMGPAILRLIGYWIDQIIFYLGYIWVLIDSRRRGWHDLIAGTVVIQEELAPRRRMARRSRAPSAARASGVPTVSVGDDDQQDGEDERCGGDEQEPPADLEAGRAPRAGQVSRWCRSPRTAIAQTVRAVGRAVVDRQAPSPRDSS